MGNGIRGRIFTWLIIAIVPVLAVALVSTSIIEHRLADRVFADMSNVRRLEATRINQELERYSADAQRLAQTASAEIFGSGSADLTQRTNGGPPDPMTTVIESSSLGAGTSIIEARVIGRDGLSLGQSDGFGWEPEPANLVASVLSGHKAKFGRAYRMSPGDDRVGLVTPIFDVNEEIVGLLLSEVSIAPIIDLLQAHETFGDTSEAYLVQGQADGTAQFISPLRFDRSAAFADQASSAPDSPTSQSLHSPAGSLVRGLDYRGEDAAFAIETIELTGWGLVVKMEAHEAFGISRSIRTLVLLGSLLAVVALILGWALLLRPLVRRIRATASAAERVAAGDYTSRIADRSQDEVGEVARGIDRLSADLEFDIRMRNDAERRLRYQATHDELTNIFNRQHMTSVIRESLHAPGDQSVSLLFLDLDDFKLVNDLWGHAVGDEVLSAVANRLRRLVGDDVYISRWGGDEFTVVLRNADETTIDELAERVRTLFAQPINTSVGPHPIACSVGVATASRGDDLDQLLHDADAKMFEEKQINRKSRMIDPDTARLVEMALADGRLEVFYQPIVSLQSPRDTRIESVEALVRIRASDGTLRLPEDFLPDVLSHRYAREIDQTIARMSMRDLASWRAAGLVSSKFLVAINLSPASMRDPGLADSLRALTTEAGIEPSSIVLELSEDADDLEPTVATSLRATGFKLAIDDLGLKRSNLDRLVTGNVDIAKIDRRWLQDEVVLEALVRTCQQKNVTVIGEGVETLEQLTMLFHHGVRLCQGFLIARPQSSAALTELLTPKKLVKRSTTPRRRGLG